MVEASAALKIVKKSLKRQDSKSMKLKALAKAIAQEMGEEKISSKTIKQWIQSSSKFNLEGKVVSLVSEKKQTISTSIKRGAESPLTVVTKKAKLVDEDGDDDDNDKDTENASTVSNNSDNDNQSTISSSSNKTSVVGKWREQNKIVLKHATDDATLTKALNQNKGFFPFTSFDSKECKTLIVPALLRQCTEGNGFTKPSPIQAQSWPILLGESPRDIVGIAETGSGKVCTKIQSTICLSGNHFFARSYFELFAVQTLIISILFLILDTGIWTAGSFQNAQGNASQQKTTGSS